MSEIDFSSAQRAIIVKQIQDYFTENLDTELGQFDAEFLLDFFSKEIGGYFYNQALTDSQTLLQTQMENMADSLFELEKLTPAQRS